MQSSKGQSWIVVININNRGRETRQENQLSTLIYMSVADFHFPSKHLHWNGAQLKASEFVCYLWGQRRLLYYHQLKLGRMFNVDNEHWTQREHTLKHSASRAIPSIFLFISFYWKHLTFGRGERERGEREDWTSQTKETKHPVIWYQAVRWFQLSLSLSLMIIQTFPSFISSNIHIYSRYRVHFKY